jgi:anti-sigma B factor antagonist
MEIYSERRDARHLVTLTGRFDAHETDEFRAHVERLLADDAALIRIDLSGVRFIDSRALAELLRTSRVAAEAGAVLILADPSDPVRVIFELTALDQAFFIEDSPTAADAAGLAA